MPIVKVYTTAYCPYCLQAKALLKHKDVPFEEIDVGNDDALREEVVRESGRRTVPQIVIDGKWVGGFDELRALENDGQLDVMLGCE